MKGTVKFFNAAKGFGFIAPDDGDRDVFVPASSITSAGISNLKPGQRVSFEVEPNGKGPKAVNLALLAESNLAENSNAHAIHPRRPEEKAGLTFYHDPGRDWSANALGALRAAGHEPLVVDYLTAPPSREELKRLSATLRGNGHSLIKRSDPLFSELRLDDRFISENEFWDAVAEHPSLINGPIVATTLMAAVCQSEIAVDAFLEAMAVGGGQNASKPKSLSERALRILRGEPEPSIPTEKTAMEVAGKAADKFPNKAILVGDTRGNAEDNATAKPRNLTKRVATPRS